MPFFDRVKRFLGFSDNQEGPQINERDSPWPEPHCRRNEDDFEAPFRNFDMFTDPLKMHQYFEQQMSEMLRNFGFHEFGGFEDGFKNHFWGDNFSHQFDLPQVEIKEIPNDEQFQEPQNLREKFLKPGYENAEGRATEEKKDQDIDGKLDIKDWGSVFKGEPSRAPTLPKTRFFNQSVTSKTIRNADGSMETHHTVRDNEGNEETTITRMVGDKEYSITKRRDKDGKEEIIENLVNLDEKEIDKYFPQQRKLPELDNKPWPYFDKFFK